MLIEKSFSTTENTKQNKHKTMINNILYISSIKKNNIIDQLIDYNANN